MTLTIAARALRRHLYGAWPQPLLGALTAILALFALAGAWLRVGAGPAAGVAPGPLLLGLILAAATVAAYHFPIHLRVHVKMQLNTIPLVLMVALLPAPLAALATAVGLLAGELSVRVARANHTCDIASEVGRRTVLALAAAVLIQTGQAAPGHLALVAAAVLLAGGDVLTYPLVMARGCTDWPHHVIRDAAREAWAMEGVQVLVSLVAALAAGQEAWALAACLLPTVLLYRAFKRSAEVQDTTRTLLESLADTVDLRDPYTGGHSRRVTAYCAQLLDALGITGPEVTLVLAAARVHDIGKIGVADAVLNKPGPLTPEERAAIQTHPVRGAELLARYPDFRRGVEIVRHHHEAWDGTGYPDGLAGARIPFGARVIAVADSFDAMTSDRPYRAGMSRQTAIAILCAGRGQQWEARLVDAFLHALAETPPPDVADRQERSAADHALSA